MHGLAEACLELFDESGDVSLREGQHEHANAHGQVHPRVDSNPTAIASAVICVCSRVYPVVWTGDEARPFSPARVHAAFQAVDVFVDDDASAEGPSDRTLHHAAACAVLVYAASVDVLACCLERIDDDVPGDSKRVLRARFVASIVDTLDEDPLHTSIQNIDSLLEVATHVWTSYRALHLDWFEGYTTLLRATALVPFCGCSTLDGYFDRVASRAQSAPSA